MARTLAQINAEIEKLKKQAEEIKSREVRGVITRIKEAIKHYGLTPPDGHFKFPHLWPPQIPPGKTAGL